jgi:hypothetical protein
MQTSVATLFDQEDYVMTSTDNPENSCLQGPASHASPEMTAEGGTVMEDQSNSEEARTMLERRRNSQASARFRQRRREREREIANSLEATRSEMQELRTRIQELSAENNLLRDILMMNRRRRAE